MIRQAHPSMARPMFFRTAPAFLCALAALLMLARPSLAEPASQGIILSIESRAESGDLSHYKLRETISAENGIISRVDAHYAFEDDESVFYQYVVIDMHLKQEQLGGRQLVMMAYNFVLFEANRGVYHEPDGLFIFDEKGDAAVRGFPFLLRDEMENISLVYRIPTYHADTMVELTLLQTNLYGEKPAGPLYCYNFSL